MSALQDIWVGPANDGTGDVIAPVTAEGWDAPAEGYGGAPATNSEGWDSPVMKC